jgi:NAD(P)-dependent dehydrogenase (short-subunit alcohol dehydrogenase family)
VQITDSSDSMMKDLIPMHRFGEPDDCSGAVAFLCDDKAAGYITGETIVIAGGLGARL